MLTCVKSVEAGHEDDIFEILKKSPALRALYNNLQNNEINSQYLAKESGESITPNEKILDLSLKIDETIKKVRPDDWRGYDRRENVIKQAVYEILGNVDEVERIFIIIKAQKEY